ncbi:MAG TPA: class I SAM-dependent methyltransferase [Phycisphaerae bacterium]|nr:class I SAM-dependent methyltransferase [Phycisphaerae bacterium]HOJ74427.1 class I SAM-dependent methyltransferase [Phycisphaerae bacterium]HOM52916.1 class I SAM-dependent methyltransferase [Phycisphaerae bacterium]HON66020.1 class I SAM-dependent methyltransferase [Phycisphaerae bacterium]HPP27100.1 class I SAM-dependent methyltransferase [Phycisphaerae bacterium]
MRDAHDHVCPNCRSTGMREFYRTGPVPVHSCLMLDDEQAAREFPRRPITLGFCSACGFVSNVVFDATVQNYAGEYQDQQSFSKRFQAFQTQLVQHLVERFAIRGKDVVEIGCGKGDFLVELCRAGDNRGVGIDPRSDSGQDDPQGRVRFLRDYYSREHWRLPCDLLVCRHTLEHLPATDEFLGLVRQGLDGQRNALVFFEVPDAGRVFSDAAFWDIYYEHCSYFTAGSLARLFRRNRFEILELRRVFEDQYLTIVARPAERMVEDALPEEETPDQLADRLHVFEERVHKILLEWKARLATLKARNRHVAVWGAGSKCVSFLSSLGCEDAVETVIDINPHQQNKFLPGSGKRIKPPDALRTRHPDVVLVMNPVYRDEIGHQLDIMGVRAELLCI